MQSTTRDVRTPDGTRVALHERTPADADEAVLFVHGATYPGGVVFDLAVPGAGATYSWLAATAAAGRIGAAVDLRGYGESDRPAAMDEQSDANPPAARAETVVADVRAPLDALAERVDVVHLVGYSWGTIICGRLLTDVDSPNVASLTQFAPVYRMDPGVVDRFDPGDPAPAYRTVSREVVADRWDAQFPDGADPAAWRGVDDVAAGADGGATDPVLDAYWSALRTTRQATDDGQIAAPNGTLLDMRDTVEEAPYDPDRIDVPTLVVRGSLDPTATRADAFRLYDDLTATREYAELSGGTHFLPLERRRAALYDCVAGFHDRVGG